jgi:hypothetical protein
MRNLKTVVALVVALTMMLGTVAFATFEDVKDTNVEEAVTTLTALEIIKGYDDGTFGPEKTITRAEFAAVVTRALGLGNSGDQKTATQFTDVPEEHWASGYVSLAASMGIIVGHGDGTFGPDDEVTYEQAIKMLVAALGYEPAAMANGGYPTGYMVIASQEKITRGASGTPGQPASRGVVSQLTYNALDVVLMEQTGFGRDPIFEKNSDGRTLLSDKLDVMKIYGTVTANEYSTLTSGRSTSTRAPEVTIKYYDDESNSNVGSDGYNATVTAKIGNTDANDFLGYKVIAYIREDNLGRDRTVVAIMEDADENEILVIDAFDIEGVDDETNTSSDRYVLEYWLDRDRDYEPERVYIEGNASLIYNGKAKGINDIYLQPISGQVTLVDTDRDDRYDVVHVKEYQYLVVDFVDPVAYTISDKNGDMVELDPTDRNYKFTITSDGEAIELEDIQEWDVLAVAADSTTLYGSNRAELIQIEVLNDTVEGKVTEFYEDDDVAEYFIDGQKYEANAAVDLADYGVGLDSEGVFFLDLDGRIVYADTSMRTSRNYAYLIDTGVESVFGSTTAQFRVLTRDGDVVIYDGASTIRFTDSSGDQGSYRQTGSGDGDHLDLVGGKVGDREEDGVLAAGQLVTIQLNTSGEITRIEEARSTGEDNVFSIWASGTMTHRNGLFGRNYEVDSNTIVFDIPEGETDYNRYSVRNGSIFGDNMDYTVELYDIDTAGNVSVVLFTDGDMSYDSGLALIDRITSSTNNDGYIVNGMYALQDGDWVNMIDDGEALEGYKPGDAILFETDARDEINRVTELFAPNANGTSKSFEKWNNDWKEDNRAELYTAYGEVTSRRAGSVNIDIIVRNDQGKMLDEDGEVTENIAEAAVNNVRFSTSGAKIYRYDFSRSSNRAAIVSTGDIRQQRVVNNEVVENGDMVFIRMNESSVEEIVIYRY